MRWGSIRNRFSGAVGEGKCWNISYAKQRHPGNGSGHIGMLHTLHRHQSGVSWCSVWTFGPWNSLFSRRSSDLYLTICVWLTPAQRLRAEQITYSYLLKGSHRLTPDKGHTTLTRPRMHYYIHRRIKEEENRTRAGRILYWKGVERRNGNEGMGIHADVCDVEMLAC